MASTNDPPSYPQKPSSLYGVNHLKFASSNILKTLQFYTETLPMIHVRKFNHYTAERKLFAVMFQHPTTNLLIEARNAPEQAAAQKGWDPITWAVATKKDLDDWAAWLDHCDVKRSKVFTGMKGWVLVCEDPDGRHVRFYCDEEHEWTTNPDADDYWLGKPVGIDGDTS